MKKGFTLIELLAVIVIMAIVALIVIPVTNTIIENARVAGARSSAYGYLDAVNNRISLGLIENTSFNGTKSVRELESELSYRGKRVDAGVVMIANDSIKEARLCISGYSFEYRNMILNKVEDDFCTVSGSFELIVLGDRNIYELDNQYTFDYDLSETDISPATNVVCNNNAVPSIANNVLHVDNIYGPTRCSINSSVETTFNDVDDTLNTILMIANDYVIANVNLSNTSDVALNLNGKTIDLNSNTIASEGILDISSTIKGTITSSETTIYNTNNLSINNTNIISTNTVDKPALYVSGKTTINSDAYIKGFYALVPHGTSSSETIINGATIEGVSSGVVIEVGSSSNVTITNGNITGGIGAVINNGSGNVNINDGTYTANMVTVDNTSTGNININGGTYISNNGVVIYTDRPSTGVVNIENAKIYAVNSGNPSPGFSAINNNGIGTINIKDNVYVENKATGDESNKGIYNEGVGTINITGSIPSFDEHGNFLSGIYVKANDGYAVYSEGGTVSINGGIYVSENNGGMNCSGGVLNVSNAAIIAINSGSSAYAWRYGMVTANDSTININDNVYIENKGMNGYSNVGVMNGPTSTININGTKAVFDEHGNYVSGIFILSNSGQGIRNLGLTNVNGAVIISADHGFSNVAATAIGNIKNAEFRVTTYNIALRNEVEGPTINICSSKVYSEKFDISNNLVATVNYASDVVFTNGTNTPKVHNSTGDGIINSGYVCP